MADNYPEILVANPAPVIKKLNEIIREWVSWSGDVERIIDQPYNPNTQLDVFADGEDMMNKHEVLQMKTLGVCRTYSMAFSQKTVRQT